MDENSIIDEFTDTVEDMIRDIEDYLSEDEIYDKIRVAANTLYEELQVLQHH